MSFSEDCGEKGDLRLQVIEGTGDIRGIVQICDGTEWKFICDDRWDNIDAQVACRLLGFGSESECILMMIVSCEHIMALFSCLLRCNCNKIWKNYSRSREILAG